MRVPWKVLPFVASLGLIASGLFSSPAAASPNGTITINGIASGTVNATVNGAPVTVAAPFTDDTGPNLTAGATLNPVTAVGVFTSAFVSPANGETIGGVGTGTVTATEDGDAVADARTLTATFQCTSPGSTQFNLSDDGASQASTVVLQCAAGVTPATLTVNPDSMLVDENVNVQASFVTFAGQAVSLTASPAIGTFTVASDTAGNTIAGVNSRTLTFTSAGGGSDILNATFHCDAPGNINFTLAQSGTTTATSGAIECGVGSESLISADPAVTPVGKSTTVTATVYAASGQTVTLTASGLGSFTAATSSGGETLVGVNTASITYTAASTADETLTATFACSAPGQVSFTLTQSGGFSTTATNLVNCSGNVPANQLPTVAAVATPNKVGCGGQSLVRVTITDPQGAAWPGSIGVTFTSDLGVVSPSSVASMNGVATATYTAPSDAYGVAHIAVAVPNGSSSTVVAVVCEPVLPPAAPVEGVDDSGEPAPPESVVIMPPSSGDGGLISVTRNVGWTSYLGLALLIISGVSACVLARKGDKQSV